MLEASEKKIRWILFDSGLGPTAIAREVGTSTQAISNYQSGRRKVEKMNLQLASNISGFYDLKVAKEKYNSICKK